MAFKHDGFGKDNIKRKVLEDMCNKNNTPWLK